MGFQWKKWAIFILLPSCAWSPSSGPKISSRFFVTSQTFHGNLGGLTGADSKCQLAADSAGLGGNWKAWLSSTVTAANSRLVIQEPLVRVTGEAIFEVKADREVGLTRFAPDISELRQSVGAQMVWTNTDTLGEAGFSDCSGWNSASSSFQAGVGETQNSTASRWTASGTANCNEMHRLYCLEQ